MQDTGTISLYRRVLRGDGDSGKRSWMGRLAGRWEWAFWIRHGRTGGSGWALAGGGWVFGQAAKNGTSGGEVGAGRLAGWQGQDVGTRHGDRNKGREG